MFQSRKDLNESDRKIMERGARRCAALIVFALLFALFSHLLAGCQEEKKPTIYKVTTTGLTWETSPDNPRQKVPVAQDMVYYVVGD